MTEKQLSIWKWTGRVLVLLAGLLGIVAAADYMPTMVKQYSALAVALLGFAARWVEQQLPAVKGPKVPPAMILLIMAGCLMASAGCKGPYDAAWRTLDSVQKAQALTAKQLASTVKAKHAACLKAHGTKTPEYATCIKKHRDALRTWRKIVRPVVNDSVAITVAAIQVAERAKDDNVNWIVLLRPAVCGLARAVKQWAQWFGDQGAAVLGAIKMIEGATCE